jgi:hypothetical protein
MTWDLGVESLSDLAPRITEPHIIWICAGTFLLPPDHLPKHGHDSGGRDGHLDRLGVFPNLFELGPPHLEADPECKMTLPTRYERTLHNYARSLSDFIALQLDEPSDDFWSTFRSWVKANRRGAVVTRT